MNTIANVYIFTNGMAIVFDACGQQMPEYQGCWEDVRERVLRDKPVAVQVQEQKCWPLTGRAV